MVLRYPHCAEPRFLGEAEFFDYEIKVDVARLLSEPEAVQEARTGLRRKIAADYRRAMEQYKDSEKWLQAYAAFPGELRVTREDSYLAGTWHPGTEAFVRTHFPNWEWVTIAELRKYAGNSYVRRILLMLSEQWQDANAKARHFA